MYVLYGWSGVQVDLEGKVVGMYYLDIHNPIDDLQSCGVRGMDLGIQLLPYSPPRFLVGKAFVVQAPQQHQLLDD